MLAPVAPLERIHALDMLRGWAMFGVLWLNLDFLYGALPRLWRGADPRYADLDGGLFWVMRWMTANRFYTLLALLFGVGFAIQLQRARDRGVDVRSTYLRRSLVLLAFGLVHAFLIWHGDVLTYYALAAFVLLLFRDANPRRIPAMAFLLWFFVPFAWGHVLQLAGLKYRYPGPGGATANWILGHGSWAQIEGLRVAFVGDQLSSAIPTVCTALLFFLLGLWAVRGGFLQRVVADQRTTRRLLLFAIVAATAGALLSLGVDNLWPSHPTEPAAWTDPWWWVPRGRVQSLGWDVLLIGGQSLAYAAILLLLWQRPWGPRVLRPLAATGRMSLTTYLTQSLVCTTLFYGYGLGWFGRVNLTGMLGLTLVIFPCQMAFSTWWLRRFRYGPAEWLWRRLTYGRPLLMRQQGTA